MFTLHPVSKACVQLVGCWVDMMVQTSSKHSGFLKLCGLCHNYLSYFCSVKAAMGNIYVNGRSCVLVQLYLPKQMG